ncbi:uncharacterized protein LOC141663813 [Apium graveolens]|uniref:uncharacterized protein LOC141663813 n=1 Tax=Apium graveolens TaxID=4045 RepID=UPI003D7A8E41
MFVFLKLILFSKDMGDNKYNSYEADEEDSKTVHKELDGIPILEVYSITYLGSSPIEPEDQIGSVSLTTKDILYDLYHETKVDPSKPSIKYGDQLPMWNVGPICSFTDLLLKFDLGMNKGSTELSVPSLQDKDQLVKSGVKSIDGYMKNISVLFGCFFNATLAKLKVRLLHIPSDATTNVYGVIMATNSKFDHPSCTSYLFSQKSDSTIQVEYNGLIPLSKSRVCVPLNSRLYVDISLFCNGLHYEGTAEFSPRINFEEVVDGKILVQITWNCSEDSYSTDEDSDYTDED